MTAMRPLRPAFPVRDLFETRAFTGDLLECNEGRSSGEGAVFGLFGHRIVAHLSAGSQPAEGSNPARGEKIPALPQGVILDMAKWLESKPFANLEHAFAR